MKCPTCGGSGEAPDTIKLECVGCQRPVTITYRDTAELHRKAADVRCRDCRRIDG